MGGGDFYHIWGEYGAHRGAIEFHQIYIRAIKSGINISLNDLAVAAKAAELGRFSPPVKDRQSIRSTYDFSLALDTEAFISVLKTYCTEANITVIEDKISTLTQNKDYAEIHTVDGRTYQANLIVNTCGSLSKHSQFESWDKKIPMIEDYAEVFQEQVVKLVDEFHIEAKTVFLERCSRFNREKIIYKLFGETDKRDARYGCLKSPYDESIVHIGAAAIRLDSPWFSMADLTWFALKPFIKMFPGPESLRVVAREYNRVIVDEYQNIRDVVQLFWNAVGTKMEPAESAWEKSERLKHKENLFRRRGKLPYYENDPYKIQWQLWMLIGLRILPEYVEPITEHMELQEVVKVIAAVKAAVAREASLMAKHEKIETS